MLKTQHMASKKTKQKQNTVMVHKSTDQTFAVPEKAYLVSLYIASLINKNIHKILARLIIYIIHIPKK